jgi:membrane protein DedA with SNARE-associated domain
VKTKGRGTLPGRWQVVVGAVLLVGVIAGMALLVEHDAAGQAPAADTSIADLLRRHGYLAGFFLVYLEESGVPLFISGDAFLLYVGHRLPHNPPALIAAWLGMILAVVLGASNLYLLARRYGRRLLGLRIAGLLHLTPDRMLRAEASFQRWGPWALIVGRHIPGLRIPLTVVAGILELDYRAFVISVAISSAAWTAAFLALGAVFGDDVVRSLRSAPLLYALALAAIVALAAGIVVRARLKPRGSRDEPGRTRPRC